MTEAELVEMLAEWAHKSWSGWTEWMFEKWGETHASGETFQARWRRQIATPYADLSEREKESDREQAREIIELLRLATTSG